MVNKLNILIVDDDAVIRTLLSRYLSPKYTVSTAEHGASALEILSHQTEPVDLVLCDIDMPEIDGLTLLRRIRADYPRIGVIMISGSTDTRTAVCALREGAYDYITKPFLEIEEVDIVIQRWQQQQSLEAKLAQYAALQREMMQNMKIRTFLSIDVVGSGEIKQGEDPFIVQFVFKAYQNFVEKLVEVNGGSIHSTSGDGAMACFERASDAVEAARQILDNMEVFNAQENQLERNFRLRMGIHTGQVVINSDGKINDMFAESLDIAGHIQKDASENSLTISEKTLNQLEDISGFVSRNKELDGTRLFDMSAA